MMSVPLTSSALKPPLEKHVQRAFFDWLRWTRYEGETIDKYAFAIPNGAHLFGTNGQRSAQMASLKAQGLKIGVPDVCIAIPVEGWHGLYLELKRDPATRSKKTDEQQEWERRLRKRGYCCMTVRGLDEAKAAVMAYLGLCR